MSIDPDVQVITDDLQAQITALSGRMTKPMPTGFRFYDGLVDFQSRPADLGLAPMELVQAWDFYADGEAHDALPAEPQVAIDNGKKRGEAGLLCSVDLELSFGLDPNDQAQHAQMMANYATMIGNFCKECAAPVGVYGGPAFLNHLAYRDRLWTFERYIWQSRQTMAALEPVVDVWNPPLYAYASDDEYINDLWRKVALHRISLCREYSDKPVVPYVWFEYHQMAGDAAGNPLPLAFWRNQLETVMRYCDGVIVWGGYKEQWDDNAGWWRVLQDVMHV